MTFNTIFWLTMGTLSLGALLLLYKQVLIQSELAAKAKQDELISWLIDSIKK